MAFKVPRALVQKEKKNRRKKINPLYFSKAEGQLPCLLGFSWGFEYQKGKAASQGAQPGLRESHTSARSDLLAVVDLGNAPHIGIHVRGGEGDCEMRSLAVLCVAQNKSAASNKEQIAPLLQRRTDKGTLGFLFCVTLQSPSGPEHQVISTSPCSCWITTVVFVELWEIKWNYRPGW